ncbi:hypothetical protein LZ32DRAFT_695249 [Colletotrichum eremochloae]|nr:hypothetical protein LZ32DRAFT_695249 [Colletotrichum eremochloae]
MSIMDFRRNPLPGLPTRWAVIQCGTASPPVLVPIGRNWNMVFRRSYWDRRPSDVTCVSSSRCVQARHWSLLHTISSWPVGVIHPAILALVGVEGSVWMKHDAKITAPESHLMLPSHIDIADSGLPAKLSQGKKLWWDDCIVMFSWTCLFVESIITQMSINIGFGRHYYSIHPKVAFGVTLLRLTSGWYKVFVWFAVVTLTVFMLPSAAITWLKCHPLEKNFNRQMEGACWDKSITLNYGILSAAWCAFMNFALALIPWKLIWEMRLERHDKICARLNGKDVTIWTAVETATAIIGSSIPVLQIFIKEKA